jgi:ribosomal protein L12E/L44/L45/RPP1/RPP2
MFFKMPSSYHKAVAGVLTCHLQYFGSKNITFAKLTKVLKALGVEPEEFSKRCKILSIYKYYL